MSLRKFLKQCENCKSTRQSMPNMDTTKCPDCGAERESNRVLEDHELARSSDIQADATAPNLEELRARYGIKQRLPEAPKTSQNKREMFTVEHVPGDRRFNKVKIIDATTGQVIGEQG